MAKTIFYADQRASIGSRSGAKIFSLRQSQPDRKNDNTKSDAMIKHSINLANFIESPLRSISWQ